MMPPTVPTPAPHAWYAASVKEFLSVPESQILGDLAANAEFDVLTTQRDAWKAQIGVLRSSLLGVPGTLLFEFTIPRMGRRIDTVLLVGPIVFAIEFKVGEAIVNRSAYEQVWDYALDLKNFHEASHTAAVIPILIVTEGMLKGGGLHADPDGVYLTCPPPPVHSL